MSTVPETPSPSLGLASAEAEAEAAGAPPRRTHRNPNRIRDHLANERTYLAWMRSAISLLGFGVLIVRIRILTPPLAPRAPGAGWKLGVAFTVVGLLMVALSALHYFGVRNDIEDDHYESPDRWVILSTLVVLALGSCVALYVFQAPFEGAAPLLVD
jgi:putative membrane protein